MKFKTLSNIVKDKIKNLSNYNICRNIKKDIKLYNIIIKETAFIDMALSYTPTFSQRIWHLTNNTIKIPKCQECGMEVGFYNVINGYKKCCSLKCSYGKVSNDKLKKTLLDKYGVEFFSKTDLWKEKTIETNIKNFGVEYHQQTEESKIKLKKTKLKKYGNENYNNPKQRKKTNLEKYGTEFATQSNEVKLKTKKTNSERYGVDYVFQSKELLDKTKETNLKKYGVEHPNQNAEYFSKSNKQKLKRKEYILPSGKVITIQGYENHTLNLLLKTHKEDDLIVPNKEIENIIGQIWYVGEDNKKHRYYPDLYCISENKIYETKSDYIFLLELNENKLKMKATKKLGLQFIFNIFDRKGMMLNEKELIKTKKPE